MISTKDIKTQWDLEGLLGIQNDVFSENYLKGIRDEILKFVGKWETNSAYLEDPVVMKEALDEYDRLLSTTGLYGVLGPYYFLKSDLDQSNTELKAQLRKIDEFGTKNENDLQFFTYRIARIPESKHKLFIDSPLLATYKHFLESSFVSGKYLLSEESEKVINLKMSTSLINWINMLSDFLTREEREVLTSKGTQEKRSFSEIMSNLGDSSKDIRDSSALAVNDILIKNSHIAEAEINSVLQDKKVDDELRGFSRPDAATHLSDDISTDVVDTMISAVSRRFEISQKYYKLKAALFGLPKLAYHDKNADFAGLDKKFTFEEAVNIVDSSLNSLDSSFSTIFNDYITKGHIDVYPKTGKESGGYCISFTKNVPTLILLNFNDRLDDVAALAHEMGHAINYELTRDKQNALNFENLISTAEVASTFFEDFAFDTISKTLTDEERFYLNIISLENSMRSVFNQVAGYNFETELHTSFREKGYLSLDIIGGIFKKQMATYLGNFVDMTPGCENWWIPWMHIRRYFYIYSYASGLLISKSLQKMVKADSKNIEKVKTFLAAGSSKSPKDLFTDLGIDITNESFWNKGIDEIEQKLNDTIDLAKSLGKIQSI